MQVHCYPGTIKRPSLTLVAPAPEPIRRSAGPISKIAIESTMSVSISLLKWVPRSDVSVKPGTTEYLFVKIKSSFRL